MPSPGRRRRLSFTDEKRRLGRHLVVLCTGVTLLAALAACGSRGHQSDASARTPVGAEGPPQDTRALASTAHAREQDILAALPLARRALRTFRGRDGQNVFTFEGYFAGRELVCVKALPPPQGDTTSVDRYLFDRGRLLSTTHEMRSRKSPDAVPDLAVHALFAPNGSTVEFEMIVNGESHDLRPMEREALLRMTRVMAKEAYDEVVAHPNG